MRQANKPDIKYFEYLRKSTDEKDRQVLSLLSQKRFSQDIISDSKLYQYASISESCTAKAPGRPGFNRMLTAIEQGKANGIVCWSIDRLYRNPVDEGRVRWLLQQGLIQSIVTASRTYTPVDAGMLMAVEGGRAADFIINLKRDVARGIEDKLRGGAWPGRRPPGFVYDHDKRNIAHHRNQVPLVRDIFSQFQYGTKSLLWVSETLAENGIKTRYGKRLSKSHVRAILTNQLYIGIMVWKGKAYEGKYEPIIDPVTFSRVAKALTIRSKPRKSRQQHDFPLRGIFHCSCRSMMTMQFGRGNGGEYRYCRCSRGVKGCTEPYVQEGIVVAQCVDLLSQLSIHEKHAAMLRSSLEEAHRVQITSADTEHETLDARLEGIREELTRLTRAYGRLEFDEDSYGEATRQLLIEKKGLKAKKRALEETQTLDWFEPAMKVIETLELATKQKTSPEVREIAELVRECGSNPTISGRKVEFGLGGPYQVVAQMLSDLTPVLTVNGWSHDYESNSCSKVCRVTDYLRTYFSSLPSS